MKRSSRSILAALLLLALAPEARGAVGDTTWNKPTHAANFPLDGLPAPGVASDPHTAAITLGFVTPGACPLQSTGVDGAVICAANPVASISFTDPLTNTGTSTAPIIGLKFTNTDLVLGGGGVLEIAGFTGAIVKAAGATSTTFGAGGAMTALANGTGSSAPPTFIGPATTGQVFQALTSSSLGWGFVPTTSITGLAAIATSGSANDLIAGTIPTARLPTFTTDVVNAGLAMTIQPNVVTFSKTQTIPALTVVANPTGSTANETTVAAGTDTTVFGRFAGALSFQPLTATAVSTIAADWPIANVRWYCLDTTGGNDANAGYSDSSDADCGTKAVKTATHLAAILPPAGGANHKIKISVNRGSYSEDPVLFLSKLYGYQSPLVVATGTVATCNATAFAGDANDQVCIGASIATGTNAGGYNPQAGATVYVIPAQLAGGGAPSFPSEPALPLGYRIRFAYNTPTVLLRNVATTISKVTSGQLELGTALPIAPSTSDVFYIEMPGVTFTTRLFFNVPLLPNGGAGLNIAGFNVGTSGNNTILSIGLTHIAFSIFSGFLNQRQGWLFLSIQYTEPTGAGTGTIVQVGSVIALSGIVSVVADSLEIDGGYSPTLSVEAKEFDTDYGSVFGGMQLRIHPSNGSTFPTIGGVGSTAGQTRAARIIGTITDQTQNGTFTAGILAEDNSVLNLGRVEFSGQGSAPAIMLFHDSKLINNQTPAASGSTGGSGVGVDLTHASGSRILIPVTPTVTGSADVKLANGTTTSWSALAAAGSTTDTAGNQIISGTAGMTLAGGALTVPALVGPGHVQVNSGGLTSVDTASYIAAPGSNGILVWTGSTTAARTLTNGDGTINFTNPDGVAANPEIHVNAIPESKVTNLVTDLTNINTAIAGKQAVGDYATSGTGPVAWSAHAGGGGVTTSVDLGAGGYTGTLPLADLAACSSGQIIGMVGSVEGCVTPTAGTVYVGDPPIVITGSHVSCPTCGTSSGSVTGVFGSSGRIVVSPSTPNPVVDLDFAGPGANTYGGAGVSSVTLDDYGRVLGVGTATYQPALSFPPANYIIASSGSGFTSDATFQLDPSTKLVSEMGLVVNGASPFPNSALIVNSATNTNRDRVQLYLGGGALPAAGPTGDSTLFGIFPHDTAVEAGVTAGIYASMRIENLTYTGTGQTITEATGLYIDGHPNLSGVSGKVYALHVAGGLSSFGDVILGGGVNIPLYSFGSGGLLGIDGTPAGGLTVNSFGGAMNPGNLIWNAGNISTSVGALMYSKDYYFDIPAALLNSGGNWIVTSSPTVFSSSVIEYAVPYAVNNVHMFISGHISSNPLIGGLAPGISIQITKNGTGMTGFVQTFGIGVTGNFNGIFVSTTSFSAGDMLGAEVKLNGVATLSGSNFTGTVSFGWDQQQ